MSSRDLDFHNAYLRQSFSDYQIYWLLSRTRGVAASHRLHYLQMALEKLAKSYFWHPDRRPHRSAEIEKSHVFVRKGIPLIYQAYYRKRCGQPPPPTWVSQLGGVCQEVDRLAPSVDRDSRPDNTEYPWIGAIPGNADAGAIAPIDHEFPILGELRTPAGRELLKCAEEEWRSSLSAQAREELALSAKTR